MRLHCEEIVLDPGSQFLISFQLVAFDVRQGEGTPARAEREVDFP